MPIEQYQYADETQTIPDWLNAMPPQPANTVMLVLPVDLFFAKGDTIIDMAQNQGLGPADPKQKQKLPTFFFAPDWVRPDATKSALGAYGVSHMRAEILWLSECSL